MSLLSMVARMQRILFWEFACIDFDAFPFNVCSMMALLKMKPPDAANKHRTRMSGT